MTTTTRSSAKPSHTPQGQAPHKNGGAANWSSGIKQFFGTAYEAYDQNLGYSSDSATAPISRVWFTGAQGVLTEIYWPAIDTAQVRDSQFLVSDGKQFFFEERTMAQTTVEWVETGVPAFKVTNRDPKGRFEIEKTIFTDPDRDVVLQHVEIKRHVAGLSFYLLHNPSVANSPFGDNARASLDGLFAWQSHHAQAVVASIPIRRASAGFEGTSSDGYQDLSKHLQLTTNFETALDGNVVLTAELDLPASPGTSSFDVAIAFHNSVESAQRLAWDSLNHKIKSSLEKYISQWSAYQSAVKDLGASSNDKGDLFRASVAVMKSMEDKTHAGAFVASPAIPWGLNIKDESARYGHEGPRKGMVSGYHLVWPRDLYQMATGFLAVNDPKSAVASLNYLKKIQYGPEDGVWEFGKHKHAKDGSFPQNCWLDGESHWTGVQLDEVSMPVVLAFRLWKSGHIKLEPYQSLIFRASDFVAEFGPWSPQERWEESFGISPSTVASEIAALRSAAVMAEALHDAARSEKYRSTAERWSRQIHDWAFTHTGAHGNGKYFVRLSGGSHLDQKWDPNDESTIQLANGGGVWRGKDIVDAGFLELVRFGIERALSNDIGESVPVVDATIRVDFPNGAQGYRRYLGDRYNYDERTGAQTLGMPWPLLTGERGHYELAKAIERGLPSYELEAAINPFIAAMEGFATPQYFIPEQVWDYGQDAGKPTGAATPLGWAHAEYVKLLRSRQDRAVFDLSVVADF